MQITSKISVSAFIDSYGHFTHHFSLIFTPSAVERMSLKKVDLNRRPVVRYAHYCPTGSRPTQQLKSEAVLVPMLVQFALPSVGMAAAAAAAADRQTDRARAKFRTVTTVAALLEFQCRNYEPLDIRNTIQRAIVYSSNTKGTKL